MKKIIISIALLVGFVSTVGATPITVDFMKITNNNTEDLSSQLGLSIYNSTDAVIAAAANNLVGLPAIPSTQFLFVFTNNVGIASNIAEIYVDNGPLTTPASVLNSLTGTTNFLLTFGGVNPGILPGGNTISPPFVADTLLSVDTESGAGKGVNSSLDKLGLLYTVSSGDLQTIQDALDDGSLRFGLHVRSIGVAEGSDSYVNDGDGGGGGGGGGTPVPEPSTILLLGAGLVGLGFFGRRKLNK